MSSSRLPRFRRSNQIASLHVTKRDAAIIRLIHRHRFLRSSQVVALLDDTEQTILRRLQLLYHHGYLNRPRTQLEYYHHGGSRPIVYSLGRKGWNIIKKDLGDVFLRFTADEKKVGRIFLEHALLVSDVMVAFELACRPYGTVRFISQAELKAYCRERRPFRWRVPLENNARVTVEPDQVFALEFLNERGEQNRVLFFIEADRGTMPVRRARLTQTSFYRKLIGYEATWAQSLHRKRFGFERFRVITVTTIPGRVQSLVAACAEIKAKGLFLFADKSILETPEGILSGLWKTGRPEETTTLLK